MALKGRWGNVVKGALWLLAMVAGVGALCVPSSPRWSLLQDPDRVVTVILVDLSESIPEDIRRSILFAAGLTSAVHDYHHFDTQNAMEDPGESGGQNSISSNEAGGGRTGGIAETGGAGEVRFNGKSVVVGFGKSVVQLPPVPAFLMNDGLISRWNLQNMGSIQDALVAGGGEWGDEVPPAPLVQWVQQAMVEDVGRNASDLVGALRYARLLLTSAAGQGGVRRVVLFSDGNVAGETGDNGGVGIEAGRMGGSGSRIGSEAGGERLGEELARLAQSSIQVDTVNVWPHDFGDVRVGKLQIPKVVRQGGSACGDVAIWSMLPAQVELDLMVDGINTASWSLALPAETETGEEDSVVGEKGREGYGTKILHHFCTPPLTANHGRAAVVSITARVASGAPDKVSGNNSSGAVVEVPGPPGILLITDQATVAQVESGRGLPTLLGDVVRSAGCMEQSPSQPSVSANTLKLNSESPGNIKTISPNLRTDTSLPCANIAVTHGDSDLWHNSVSPRLAYDLVILDDVHSTSFSPDLDRYLGNHVSRGGGLITIGGPDSYGPGGWGSTSLGQMLPVRIDPRSPDLTMAVVYVLDKSGSMGGTGQGGQHMLLAKSTLRTLLESLQSNDLAGIIAHDQRSYPVLPLIRAGRFSMDQVDTGSVGAGGSTDPASALVMAGKWLSASSARVKKIILLGDGKIAPGVNLEPLLENLTEKGITVSTIGVGTDADQEKMRSIALLGGGQTGSINTFDELERAVEEAILGPVSGLLRSGLTTVLPGPDYPQRQSLIPPISGYVATAATDNAYLWLVSSNGDPILAGAQVGNGRVVSLTTDLHGIWTGKWTNWGGKHELFRLVTGWALEMAHSPHTLSMEALPGGVIEACYDGTWLDWGGLVEREDSSRVEQAQTQVEMGSPEHEYIHGPNAETTVVGKNLRGVTARLVCVGSDVEDSKPMEEIGPGHYGAYFKPCASELTELIVKVVGQQEAGGAETNTETEAVESEVSSLYYVDPMGPELSQTGSNWATLSRISYLTSGRGPLSDRFPIHNSVDLQADGMEPVDESGSGGTLQSLSEAAVKDLSIIQGRVNPPLLLLFMVLFLLFLVV